MVFVSAYPFLEELRLKRMTISDESLEFLGRSFPGFKVLSLTSCDGFSINGLASIASYCSIETITLGDKRIGIRTSVLEEKATACNMLFCYADQLKEGFYPWIDQVATTLVPLLKFYFHEEVRKAAVSDMPELLRSAKLVVEKRQAPGRDESYVKQLSDFIIPALVEALHKEPETEICASMLDSLNECIQSITRAYGRVDADGSRYLLSDNAGLLHLLVITHEREKVTGLKIEHLGETSVAPTISYLDNAGVYVGSSYGDSQLYYVLSTPTTGLSGIPHWSLMRKLLASRLRIS